MYLTLAYQHLFRIKYLLRVGKQARPVCTREEHRAIKRNKLLYLQHRGCPNSVMT